MTATTLHCRDAAGSYVALSGLALQSLLSPELLCESSGVGTPGSPAALAGLCRERWRALAQALASLPEPAELCLLVGGPASCEPATVFFVVGRGASVAEARQRSARMTATLERLLEAHLDYARFVALPRAAMVRQAAALLRLPVVVELHRRQESLALAAESLAHTTAGFRRPEGESAATADSCPPATMHRTVPWVPSSDPWHVLLQALADEPGASALVVHLRGFRQAPQACLQPLRVALGANERALLDPVGHAYSLGLAESTIPLELARRDAALRLSLLDGPAVAARVFVLGRQRLSAFLLATAQACLDEPTADVRDLVDGATRGGVELREVTADEVLRNFDHVSLLELFGLREATAVLRTVVPASFELCGVEQLRARTAPPTGLAHGGCALGTSLRRGRAVPVRFDDECRFLHTYVVGKTGSGKSTLLANLALHEIEAGKGVAVLDPHGSLVADLLARFPRERADAVVLVDMADLERPVGFNILRIDEDDPLRYRTARDRLIDDLYSALDRIYDMRQVAGPMFETHFRGMLGLLLGTERPVPPCIPNLLVMHELYFDEALRKRLLARIKGHDVVLDTFLREAENVSGEGALKNIAPYVTSKFNRFISDLGLRNMTCQNSMLDIDALVAEGKVLLFCLGKGRVGELPAGLLASQIVSRIWHAVLKRGPGGNHRPFHLFVDEFHLFADERFAELLAEARKFRLALTVAHQYVQQLPERVLRAVLGNVGTTVALRVGTADAATLRPLFAPQFGERDLVSLPNYHAYVRSTGALGDVPFSVRLPEPVARGSEKVASALRELSRLRYGRDREVVEEEIRETLYAFRHPEESAEPYEHLRYARLVDRLSRD